MIIGISGKIGSGKDTFTDCVNFAIVLKKRNLLNTIENFNKFRKDSFFRKKYENKKFAFKLKQIASILTSEPVGKFEDIDFKNSKMSPEWGDMTYREFLQKLGTEAIRTNIHNEAWTNALFSDYNENKDWIISDVRFPNEFQSIKDRGGIVVRIEREKDCFVCGKTRIEKSRSLCCKVECPDGRLEHQSETALDLFQFDYIIDNNGKIEDLIGEAEIFVEKFNL